jgi:hypothetical protein
MVVGTSNDYDRWHQHEKSDEGFHYFMAPFLLWKRNKGNPTAPARVGRAIMETT